MNLIEQIGALPINTTAKLVGIAMTSTGETSSAKLAQITGLKVRSVQRAKREYEAACVKNDASNLTHVTDDASRMTRDVKIDASETSNLTQTVTNDASDSRTGDITTRANFELPTEVLVTKKIDSPFCPPGDEKRVKFEKGELLIFGSLRSFWLEQFGGDATALDLALMQAAGYVQPNSFRPLEAQVSSQLAKTARERRERDQRYDRAAQARASQPAKPADMTARERRIAASAKTRALIMAMGDSA